MSLASKLRTDVEAWNHPDRVRRFAPVGAGIGGLLGAVAGTLLVGGSVDVGIVAGASAALAVLVTWVVLAALD